MYPTKVASQKIKILTDKETTGNKPIAKMVYNNLSLRQKLNKKMSVEYIEKGIKESYLFYHPFWIAKLLVIASRRPFPSKIIPHMAFVDAVSGYRGLLSNVPFVEELVPEQGEIIPPLISSYEQALTYVKDIQEKQINSMYMMKKPTHEVKELSLNYLPIWKVIIQTPLLNREMLINANTGESEDYLLSLWKESNVK